MYSKAEELANSVSHGIGAMLSVAGFALMVTLAILKTDGVRIASVVVFCTTLILLYSASTMYHALTGERAKRIFRVIDHSAIYLLIAGTYTPIALGALGGARGLGLCIVIWVLAAIGLINSIPSRWRITWIEIVLYLAMGWMAVVVAKPLYASIGSSSTMLIFGGGLAYTGGLIFYGWRSLPFSHFVWHLFVLAGSILHFFAILYSVVL